MEKKLSILGSTGSIGCQTLDVVRGLGLSVTALAAYQNISLLEKQIREFKPQLVAVFDLEAAKQLKIAVADMPVTVVSGMEGLCLAAAAQEADLVLNSVVGMVGLRPTLAAIDAKKNVALANKETLVAGGSLVMQAAKEKGVRIIPVDSEHSAVFQCLYGCTDHKQLKRIILTASGGPFFGKTKEELRYVTAKQALNHPNWSMGAKVTIDSATMMNKGLELIEAAWLFSMPMEQLDVVVHRVSIIHSLIEYQDNSVLAQSGVPDMRIPIQYAITFPQRYPSPCKQLDLTECGQLSFYKPDYDTFRCLNACRNAFIRGGLTPAATNGANEEAVKLFLQGRIDFLTIGDLVTQAMERQNPEKVTCIEDVLEADASARRFVLDTIG